MAGPCGLFLRTGLRFTSGFKTERSRYNSDSGARGEAKLATMLGYAAVTVAYT